MPTKPLPNFYQACKRWQTMPSFQQGRTENTVFSEELDLFSFSDFSYIKINGFEMKLTFKVHSLSNIINVS